MKTRDDVFNDESQRPYNPDIVNIENPFSADRALANKFVEDKVNLHETIASQFSGILTVVDYFHQVETSKDSAMQSSSSVSSFSIEYKEYDFIHNFEVKLENTLNLNQEGDEVAHNYIRGGTLYILPGTIIPFKGDFFIMRYMKRDMLFNITNVTKEAPEMNSSFICEFVIDNIGQDFNYKDWIVSKKIRRNLYFKAEYVGTNYKTILEESEIEDITYLKDLYNYIGDTYYSYFYDKRLNSYVLRNVYQHNPDESQDLHHKINNKKYNDNNFYDNLLNHFIKDNDIFINIRGRITVPTVLINFQPIDYDNTIFKALEIQDNDQITYKYLNYEAVNSCNIYIPSSLHGYEYIKHVKFVDDKTLKLLPENFFEYIEHLDLDKLKPFDLSVYASDSFLITEIIAIFLTKALDKNQNLTKTDKILERIRYLYKRKQKLTMDNMLPQYIYYLFPILGYIIIHYLNKKYNKQFKEKII